MDGQIAGWYKGNDGGEELARCGGAIGWGWHGGVAPWVWGGLVGERGGWGGGSVGTVPAAGSVIGFTCG